MGEGGSKSSVGLIFSEGLKERHDTIGGMVGGLKSFIGG